MNDFAAAQVRRGAVTDTAFVVTPAMRDALFALATQRGIDVSRPAYDEATSLVDRQLGNELARQAFGLAFAGRRVVRNDRVVQRAAGLLRAAADPRQLLARLPAAADSGAR